MARNSGVTAAVSMALMASVITGTTTLTGRSRLPVGERDRGWAGLVSSRVGLLAGSGWAGSGWVGPVGLFPLFFFGSVSFSFSVFLFYTFSI